jgi:hypothetical protein
MDNIFEICIESIQDDAKLSDKCFNFKKKKRDHREKLCQSKSALLLKFDHESTISIILEEYKLQVDKD